MQGVLHINTHTEQSPLAFEVSFLLLQPAISLLTKTLKHIVAQVVRDKQRALPCDLYASKSLLSSPVECIMEGMTTLCCFTPQKSCPKSCSLFSPSRSQACPLDDCSHSCCLHPCHLQNSLPRRMYQTCKRDSFTQGICCKSIGMCTYT